VQNEQTTLVEDWDSLLGYLGEDENGRTTHEPTVIDALEIDKLGNLENCLSPFPNPGSMSPSLTIYAGLDTASTPQENRLQPEETSEPEVLPPALALFREGKEIGSALEHNLRKTIADFYDKALPFAQTVADQKPWYDPDYAHYDGGEPSKSLYLFLKGSFAAGSSNMTAGQQARLIAVAVDRGWTLAQLHQLNFKEGLEIARVVHEIPGADADRLLEFAATHGYNDVKAECYRAKHGVHIEPNKDKTITASSSAIAVLDDFDEKTKANGDTRPLGEKLSDFVGESMMATPNFDQRHAAVWLHSMNIAVWKHLHPEIKDIEDCIVAVMFETPAYGELVEECPPALKDKWLKARQAFEATL
jgi:hypothetical protein